jgi:phosphoribosylaminoimidazole-succinocarboxamide synthase
VTSTLRQLDIDALPLFRRGKVRDTWDLGDMLLMVASDRLSAFDVILPDPVPDKGRVLTQLSAFWFRHTEGLVPNHLVSTDVADLPASIAPLARELEDRFMIVRKARRVDIECVARGYLAGSAWVEYRDRGTVCGQELPAGLAQSAQLPTPIFTPAMKNDTGHDENISVESMRGLVGDELTSELQRLSLLLYQAAAAHALERGVIIADTKFEFGWIDGELRVIDELLTPDSSRFWDVDNYEPGRAQDSYDKQPVRDWLLAAGWDRNPPAPSLPAEVIEQTAARYRTAFERLTGTEFRRP